MVGTLIATSSNTHHFMRSIQCWNISCMLHIDMLIVALYIARLFYAYNTKHQNTLTTMLKQYLHTHFLRAWFFSVVLCRRISGLVVIFPPYLRVCVFYVCRRRRRRHSRFFQLHYTQCIEGTKTPIFKHKNSNRRDKNNKTYMNRWDRRRCMSLLHSNNAIFSRFVVVVFFRCFICEIWLMLMMVHNTHPFILVDSICGEFSQFIKFCATLNVSSNV